MAISHQNQDALMPKGTNSPNGRLIMASNSLGLPLDIPIRSLEALRSSDILVFEEDRPARQSLKAAGIHRDYLKLTEHKEATAIHAVRDALKAGKTVCYMSDQGMPTLADPGQELLDIAYKLSAKVEIIPGPSSISATLAACPFLDGSFYYKGFLNRDPNLRSEEIKGLAELKEPIVFLDTPYRRKAVLGGLLKHFGGNRRAVLGVDISGPQEGFFYDSLKNLEALDLGKLNFVIVTEGAKKTKGPYKKAKSSSRE